eukprot:scaffold61469_cov44-Phaeocystis_antarctica.AAC.2
MRASSGRSGHSKYSYGKRSYGKCSHDKCSRSKYMTRASPAGERGCQQPLPVWPRRALRT